MDKTTLYKEIFANHLKERVAASQARLILDLLTLQDKKIHALFANYHDNHHDADKLFIDIKVLLNLKDVDEPNISKPTQITHSLSNPEPQRRNSKDSSTQIETPVFDKNKNNRMESLREEINLSSIKVTPVQPDSETEEDPLPSFNEALLTFILKKEGISDKFIAKLIKCLEACEKGDETASESLINEFIDYGKSRLVNILKDDFTYKETSHILRHPEQFKECFEKSNRLRADPKAFLRANLKETLKSVDLDKLENEEDDLESPV